MHTGTKSKPTCLVLEVGITVHSTHTGNTAYAGDASLLRVAVTRKSPLESLCSPTGHSLSLEVDGNIVASMVL